jgi:hypothetical protein
MKYFSLSRTAVAAVCLFSALVLSGCSGFEGTSFPVVTTQSSPGAIQGGVFGGHAPIVGAHVFVMEALSAGTAPAGYAGASSSKILTTGGTLDGTTGNYYVTTDTTGSFNITGDYTCDVGQPVYLYAPSGASIPATGTAITVIAATATPVAATGGTTYTIQFTGTNSLVVGQQVSLTVSSATDGDYATYLSGTLQNVTAATATTFTIKYSNAAANLFGTSGTTAHMDVVTGTGTPGGVNNPAIVNLAMLGNCPSTGNFSTGSTALHYVYLNEVSTIATAYAMAGFGTDGLHIGSSANGVTGLANAALNASNLYNVQNNAGALAVSAVNGGTVPQAELNTLGNILAACVDSANTSVGTTTTALAAESTACSTLFKAATSNGVAATSGATIPTDIATAAFNMAHNPGTTSVVGLWNSAGTNTPFAPNLSAKPNDFTVAITYPVTAPAGLAIDATGDVYVATNSTTAGYVTELSPLGPAMGTTPITSATGGTGMTSVAIDATGNVWASAKTSNALYKYTSALGAVTGSPFTNAAMANPNQIAIDTTGNVYVAQTTSGNVGSLVEFSNAGALMYNVNTNSNAAFATAIALDKVGTATDVWLVSNQNNAVTLFGNPSGGSSTVGTGSGFSTPTGIAVDSLGNAWASNSQSNRPLYKVATNGTTTYWGVDSTGNNPIGGLSAPKWVAIDGAENVWVTNATGSSVSEISGATSTLAYSPSTGYQAGSVTGAAAIAVDGSGDIWIANQTGNNVMQIIGVATPVKTPLSAQKPGVEP